MQSSNSKSNNLKSTDIYKKIFNTLTKFRQDIIFDEFMGIFEKVPAETRDNLMSKYQELIREASELLGISALDLEEDVNNHAMEQINGTSYSEEDVKDRLKDYGVIT